MKENLNVQFVYPDYALPAEYETIVESIDHVKIVSSHCESSDLKKAADIVVFNGWDDMENFAWNSEKAYVLRTPKAELFERCDTLKTLLGKAGRLNVVITDVETFTETDFEKYKRVLASLSESIEKRYIDGQAPQLNVLTDRMMLEAMNNCNAGDEVITLAPDGRFYVCPAFYYEQAYSIGSHTKSATLQTRIRSNLSPLRCLPVQTLRVAEPQNDTRSEYAVARAVRRSTLGTQRKPPAARQYPQGRTIHAGNRYSRNRLFRPFR